MEEVHRDQILRHDKVRGIADLLRTPSRRVRTHARIRVRICLCPLKESPIHAAVCRSLFGNGGPFPWVNCSESDRKFRAA